MTKGNIFEKDATKSSSTSLIISSIKKRYSANNSKPLTGWLKK
jgi:hypothetical protein